MANKLFIASLAAVALAAPALANAQPVSDYRYNGYNPDVKCQQSVNNNRTTGGLVGAVAGAAIGSNVAGRGVRTEGAVLGAVLGAVVGSEVAKNRLACDDQYQYERNRSYNRNYNGYSDNNYRRNSYYGNSGYNNNYNPHQNARCQYPVNYSRHENCGWGNASYALPNGRMVNERVYMCRQRDGDWVVVDR